MRRLTITEKDLDKAIKYFGNHLACENCIISMAVRREWKRRAHTNSWGTVRVKPSHADKTWTGNDKYAYVSVDPVLSGIAGMFDTHQHDKLRSLLPITVMMEKKR